LIPEFTQGEWVSRKAPVLAALHGLLHPNPHERLDCIEALSIYDPGNNWLKRFGAKWLALRAKQRQGKN
jgi:hypothetical protein